MVPIAGSRGQRRRSSPRDNLCCALAHGNRKHARGARTGHRSVPLTKEPGTADTAKEDLRYMDRRSCNLRVLCREMTTHPSYRPFASSDAAMAPTASSHSSCLNQVCTTGVEKQKQFRTAPLLGPMLHKPGAPNQCREWPRNGSGGRAPRKTSTCDAPLYSSWASQLVPLGPSHGNHRL